VVFTLYRHAGDEAVGREANAAANQHGWMKTIMAIQFASALGNEAISARGRTTRRRSSSKCANRRPCVRPSANERPTISFILPRQFAERDRAR
jgi:hypothetical protein